MVVDLHDLFVICFLSCRFVSREFESPYLSNWRLHQRCLVLSVCAAHGYVLLLVRLTVAAYQSDLILVITPEVG